jgi:hypothetical protein
MVIVGFAEAAAGMAAAAKRAAGSAAVRRRGYIRWVPFDGGAGVAEYLAAPRGRCDEAVSTW